MLKNLINLLFPSLCFGCGELLIKNEKLLCSSCNFDLPFTTHLDNAVNETFSKFYGILPLEYAASMLYFSKDGLVQKLIHNLKYRGKQEIGSFLGAMYGSEIRVRNLKFDVIIPVPLHKKKLRERGYNQITTFCEALAFELSIPIKQSVLYRQKYNVSQTKKNKEERDAVKDAIFNIHYSSLLENKHILLVDDVLTTGATLATCAKLLLEHRGATISIITIAYTSS